MSAPGEPPSDEGEAGFVLLSVLAIFIVVGAVLAAAILQVRSATGLAQARAEAVRLQGEADGIARLIAYRLDLGRTYRQSSAGLPEDGTVTACPLAPGRRALLSLQDQGTLIDLNGSPRPAMEEAFRLLGVSDREALALGAEIVDYRDPDDAPEPNGGAELPQYRARGLPWGPRNAPFASIDEIDRLPSMTPAIAARLRPVLTVYNEGGRFDLAALVRRANPSAIRSLPGSAGPVPSPRQVFRLSVVVEAGRARAGRSAILNLGGGSGFLVWQQTVAADLVAGTGHPACALVAAALGSAP
ncbi:general secretion pathway protein GspK [Methylobacterium sp. SyP6R]|uniref:general secretion pathway protein GspK n=1 Tax=Methylobacterium sp. SyP6R TaxID=2718876 RepID=UPI001F026A3E|nr:type II secretion system protein GspK [Methylobacterium sp. SyP6R]MCF4125463.1 type II secretion system protein GspK [Methylobacterium sp. SyP6R]